ncbi:MAG TPA: wax ester/triacylglycerol synthase family O-acyltransferase, partial [Actinomycetota bacterium]|nr:wax ester/triacylglycerol synthase family O-acyltransferase [Actinomycetota bacterium]
MPPERLTALDASFLYLERPAMHMHVAALSVFDPSSRPDGRLRHDDVARVIASRLHLAPRFRRKVVMVPGHLGLPVWVDDPRFDLGFHVRHSALPSPGGRRELTDTVQRVLSRPLDRTKPLWELYVIEGLEEGHVATLLKVHHAMIDGVSGMQLAAVLYDVDPTPPEPPAPPRWSPEPEPPGVDLVRDAVLRQITHPVQAVLDGADQVMHAPVMTAIGLGVIASGVRSILGMGARPPSPLDVAIGPNRRFAITEAPLQ